jgi:Ubiquitin-2 like Rad60 SUMO-like
MGKVPVTIIAFFPVPPPSNASEQLMRSYCERQSIDPRSIRFLYDGTSVLPDSTPEQLGAILT